MPAQRLPDFDDAVLRAMEKWPDVPHCFGWLSLDRRGGWRIRGALIQHPRAIAFLGRNYCDDEHGRWFVQNGPQRVFVELEYTPWILRFDRHNGFSTHTAVDDIDIDGAFEDDQGNVLLRSKLGIGLLDDRDLAALAESIDDAEPGQRRLHWRDHVIALRTIARLSVPATFGFVADPQTLDTASTRA